MTSDSRIVLPDEWRWMRWRNGGGRTAEIHVAGDAETPDWRLSLAVIERDGPFSAWPGVDRTLIWLDGGRLDLDVNGERRCLDRLGARIDFAGEDAVEAKVVQRTTVLNLMVRRASGWRQVAAAGSGDDASIRIAHAIRAASVAVAGRQLDLPAQATLITQDTLGPIDGAGPMIVLALST